MAIKEVPGKLFQSDRVIRCIAVNCSGNVTGDFAKEIKEDYPEVIKPYTEMCRVLGEKALGEVQFTVCHDDTIVASMFVQEVGIGNRAIVNSNILHFLRKDPAYHRIPGEFGCQPQVHRLGCGQATHFRIS